MALLRFDKELKLRYPIIKNNFNEMTNFNEMAKIAKGKMLLKEYGQKNNSNEPSVIYLEDGDEFQIQLFNPTNKVVGATIEFNGDVSFSPSIIVLKPGERIWLERYLDSPRKFQFNTYTVSNNKSSREAIKDNGDLIIKFYYEKKPSTYSSSTITWTNANSSSYPWDYGKLFYSTCCDCNDTTRSKGISTYCGDSVNSITTASACLDTLSFASCDTAATTHNYSSSATASTKPVNRCMTKNISNKIIETGRVEEGAYSNQSLKHVYYDFESWYFYSKSFKLLPVSCKQYDKEDLSKVYCTNCGKKLSPKFKFCPACGAKVNY